VVLVVFAVGYFVYKNVIPAVSSQKNVSPAQVQPNVDLSQAPVVFTGKPSPAEPFDFKGTLYLSLMKINGQNALGIYAFNINGTAGSKFTTILASKISANIFPSVSADGEELVFIRGKPNDPIPQIFMSDISGENIRQITNTPDKYKGEPIFSPSGELIAYESATSSVNNSDLGIPESWSTYLIDTNGSTVKIANGINPIFSPDGGKLLILQNDGLHLYDISVWTKPKPLGLVVKTIGGSKASGTKQIEVSADGEMIAWSSTDAENVVVSRINSWDTFSISPFLTIKTKAYWPVFSPDGKYLALDEWRKDGAGNEYPVIMGYDLSNGTSEKIVTLLSDNKEALWLGAWK